MLPLRFVLRLAGANHVARSKGCCVARHSVDAVRVVGKRLALLLLLLQEARLRRKTLGPEIVGAKLERRQLALQAARVCNLLRLLLREANVVSGGQIFELVRRRKGLLRFCAAAAAAASCWR